MPMMFITRRKMAASICLMIASILLSNLQLPACAEEIKSGAEARTLKHSQPSPKAVLCAEGEAVTLGDLRDVGLAIMQIKQQAINIFLDVTRRDLTSTSSPGIAFVTRISSSDLHAGAKYLPTRPEWLTFYVGAMEPIIHLLKSDVKDVEDGVAKLIVPSGCREKFEKLYIDYRSDVAKLNEHLTKIYEGIGDKQNNLQLAQEAIHMFQIAEDMERKRVNAFQLMKTASNAEVEELPMPTNK